LKIKNLGIDEGLFNRISEVAQHMPFYNLLGISEGSALRNL
jgi:hypothetical protein